MRLLVLVFTAAAAVPALGTAAAAVAVPAIACQPGLSISLLPLEEEVKGRDASYIVADLTPGQRLRRTIRVCNGEDTPFRIELYSNAAGIQDGSFLPLGSPRAENDLSRWTTVTPGSLTLRPDVPVDVPVTIQVPKDAPRGERYAVIYAELPAPTGGSGVSVASRVGVRQYVFVRGEEAPRTDFVIDSLTAGRDSSGRPVVSARVENTGDRAVDLAGTLRLAGGPGGISAGPFAVTLGTTLAPGDSAPVEVLLDRELPAGPWVARLELSSGATRRAAEATITFPDAAGDQNAPVEAKELPLREDPSVVIPIAIGVFGLALLLLLLALLRRRTRSDEKDELAAPAAGDDGDR